MAFNDRDVLDALLYQGQPPSIRSSKLGTRNGILTTAAFLSFTASQRARVYTGRIILMSATVVLLMLVSMAMVVAVIVTVIVAMVMRVVTGRRRSTRLRLSRLPSTAGFAHFVLGLFGRGFFLIEMRRCMSESKKGGSPCVGLMMYGRREEREDERSGLNTLKDPLRHL